MDKNMHLSDAILQFVAYKVNRYGSTKTTASTYSSNLGDFMSWAGNITIDLLTVDLVDRFAEHLATRNYKPKTYKNKIVIIRSFIRYLYSKNAIDVRPESIDVPRVQATESNFLDDEEQKKLIDSITNVRDKAIILTMLRSGLRVSEVCELRTYDIFERSLVVRCGKGKKPRVTFITLDADTAIKKYLKTKPYTEYLFTNDGGHQDSRGTKLTRQIVTRIVARYGKPVNPHKNVSAHTLRHTFATNMLRKGARIEDVQPMMGHANIQTTRLYMHFTNDYLHQRYDEVMTKTI